MHYIAVQCSALAPISVSPGGGQLQYSAIESSPRGVRPRLHCNPAGDAHPNLNYHLCIVSSTVQYILYVEQYIALYCIEQCLPPTSANTSALYRAQISGMNCNTLKHEHAKECRGTGVQYVACNRVQGCRCSACCMQQSAGVQVSSM